MTMASRGHICPPSDAKHPSDRWESLFVYSFICKFTGLRGKVEGLETPLDLENALLSRQPTPIITEVLRKFILNLRPQTRNTSEDQISSTVATVLSDYFRTNERTIFWSDELNKNVDPFSSLEGGFFAADWDFKLKILRQLVELQLSHSAEVKAMIDLAWGVNANKSKKKDPATAPPDPSDPKSKANLQLLPLGQDWQRKRYWVCDKSSRIYVSTNPWKTTATFQSVSSTREEYVVVIEKLKQNAPQLTATKAKAKKLTKQEASHQALIEALEERLDIIDAEIARVARARRKVEQRKLLMEQAELRQTRTRRQTRKPDYVEKANSEDDGDEYIYQEDEGYEEDYVNDDDEGSTRSSRRNRSDGASHGQRRSTRTAVLNANGKREVEQDNWSIWRGERRSARLGAPAEIQLDYAPLPKRARTDDSTLSANSSEAGSGHSNGVQVKNTGAAALKPTEFATDQLPGRKRSKYWVYAVEPIPGAVPPSDDKASAVVNGDDASEAKLSTNDHTMDVDPSANGSVSPPVSGSLGTNVDSGVDIPSTPSPRVQTEFDRSMTGSLSPLSPP